MTDIKYKFVIGNAVTVVPLENTGMNKVAIITQIETDGEGRIVAFDIAIKSAASKEYYDK